MSVLLVGTHCSTHYVRSMAANQNACRGVITLSYTRLTVGGPIHYADLRGLIPDKGNDNQVGSIKALAF